MISHGTRVIYCHWKLDGNCRHLPRRFIDLLGAGKLAMVMMQHSSTRIVQIPARLVPMAIVKNYFTKLHQQSLGRCVDNSGKFVAI